MRQIPQPTGALAEMLARDGELDRILDGRGITITPAEQIGPPPTVPQPIHFPEPDWAEELAERNAAERKAREDELEAELLRRQEAVEEEPAKHPPAARKTSSATPRKDAIVAWLTDNRR